MKALIGHSGFVGTTLKRQADFTAQYRSTDIDGIAGRDFDMVVCAGVPAQKWIADRDPEADIANIRGLADHLATITARGFVLVSTVDVFADSRGMDEDSAARPQGAYGSNRLWLEHFVRDRFPKALIVRLPGLVGPGLRKNAVFDLRNDNALHAIDGRARYQFYPMVNLWCDLQAALSAGLELVHFTAAPLSIAEIADECFGRDFGNTLDRPPAAYDLHSRHAGVFGGSGPYLYSRRESLLAIRAYAQSEPPSQAFA